VSRSAPAPVVTRWLGRGDRSRAVHAASLDPGRPGCPASIAARYSAPPELNTRLARILGAPSAAGGASANARSLPCPRCHSTDVLQRCGVPASTRRRPGSAAAWTCVASRTPFTRRAQGATHSCVSGTERACARVSPDGPRMAGGMGTDGIAPRRRDDRSRVSIRACPDSAPWLLLSLQGGARAPWIVHGRTELPAPLASSDFGADTPLMQQSQQR
jgi:hypothetical protein